MRRQPHRRRDPGCEHGQTLVLFAVAFPVLIALAALVIDVGYAYAVKRHLQQSADAAALAAAAELPNQTAAASAATLYGAGDGGRNRIARLPSVETAVTFPDTTRIRVTQTATTDALLRGVFGFGGFEVSATAVAGRASTATAGTPYAVFVHELCGASTGNKGFHIAGDNARIEGAIHVNGQFKIGNPGFRSFGPATVFRPPHAESPTPPNQGSCTGSGAPRIENHSSARYDCTDASCAAFDGLPAHGAFRNWATEYARNGTAWTKAQRPCTINPPDKVEFKTAGATIPAGVYCLQPGKEFVIAANNVRGNITVFAEKITVGGSGGVLKPFDAAHPILFYNTSALELIVNPSGSYDWEGHIINPFSGITINASGVTSPQKGFLEAKWLVVNGANFRMLGAGPPVGGGVEYAGVALDE